MADVWLPKENERLCFIYSQREACVREFTCYEPNYWVLACVLGLAFPLSERDKAEARCAELNKLAEEALKPKRWKPERGEEYWWPNHSPDNYNWSGDDIDQMLHESGRVFRTEQECQEYLDDLKVWSLKRAEEKANG